MNLFEQSIERNGPRRNDYDPPAVEFDHIYAYIDDNRKLFMRVDNYRPEPESSWDVDEWEQSSCYLLAKATQSNWKLVFRIGRILARYGRVTINTPGREPEDFACDGSTLYLS